MPTLQGLKTSSACTRTWLKTRLKTSSTVQEHELYNKFEILTASENWNLIEIVGKKINKKRSVVEKLSAVRSSGF